MCPGFPLGIRLGLAGREVASPGASSCWNIWPVPHDTSQNRLPTGDE
jgi:hypothetical protein